MFIGESQFIASNRIQYSMRYSGRLQAGETLTAASATLVNYLLATIDTVVIETPNSDFFTFYLTGGSAGDSFQINLQATTSLGQVFNDYMLIVVGPNGAAYSYSGSLLGPTGPSGGDGAAGVTGPTGPEAQNFWPSAPLAAPPVVSAWTQHNFAASTSAVDFTEGLTGVRLKTAQPSNNTNNHRSLIKAAPSTPYDLIGRFRRQQPIAIGNGGTVHHALGLVMYESATGKAMLYGLGNNQASSTSLVRHYMTNDSTFATNFEMWGSADSGDVPWEWWVKIHNDGTTLKFYYSLDGWYWNYVNHVPKITPFTTAPNYVGFGMIDGWFVVNSDNNATPEIVLDCGGWSCS